MSSSRNIDNRKKDILILGSYLFVNGRRSLNLKQKILKLFHIHYVDYSLETFQKIGQIIIWKKQDLMVTFMILALIIMLLQVLIY